MATSTFPLRRLSIASLGVAVGVIVAACGGGDATPTGGSAAEVSPTPTTPEIIELLRPSIVHIQTEAVRLDTLNRPVSTGGVGTGEIIDLDGHILTNNHVIEGAERIIVTLFDGRGVEAQLIGRDPSTDLAVIQIPAEGLTPIPIGRSADVRVGDHVIAIGHALDLPGGPTVTGGWVSALDRSIPSSPTITMNNLIQTDAAINPGNSGGPLVNTRGEFIGVNTAKIEAGEGIGFAIAIDPVMPLIQEMIARGRVERGFLGVSVVAISEALARNADLPVSRGVGIVSVAPGSPAEAAGLRERDIIVAVDDQEVVNPGDFESVLVRYRSGSSVRLTTVRGDETLSFEITLGDRPTES